MRRIAKAQHLLALRGGEWLERVGRPHLPPLILVSQLLKILEKAVQLVTDGTEFIHALLVLVNEIRARRSEYRISVLLLLLS
jgi:hypothetical protein